MYVNEYFMKDKICQNSTHMILRCNNLANILVREEEFPYETDP